VGPRQGAGAREVSRTEDLVPEGVDELNVPHVANRLKSITGKPVRCNVNLAQAEGAVAALS
jgi:hypothetical protein